MKLKVLILSTLVVSTVCTEEIVYTAVPAKESKKTHERIKVAVYSIGAVACAAAASYCLKQTIGWYQYNPQTIGKFESVWSDKEQRIAAAANSRRLCMKLSALGAALMAGATAKCIQLTRRAYARA